MKAADFTTGLAALTRAVNERRVAIGLSTRAFQYNEDGDTAAYPTAAQFAGLLLHGQKIQGTFGVIQDEILALPQPAHADADTEAEAGSNFLYFVTASNGDTRHTNSSLTGGPYGSTWPENPDVWNAKDWGRMRYALNSLIYVRVHVGNANAIISGNDYHWLARKNKDRNGYEYTMFEPSASEYELAWDDMLTESLSANQDAANTQHTVQVRVWNLVDWAESSPTGASAHQLDEAELTFDLTGLSGSITSSGKLAFRWDSYSYEVPPHADFGGIHSALTLDIDGNYSSDTMTIPAGSGSGDSGTEAFGTEEFSGLQAHSLSSTTPLDFSWDSTPGNVPFETASGYNIEGIVLAMFYYAIVYLNISGELTDQD
jgi:hypothetical protein